MAQPFPTDSEAEARDAITRSRSYAEALRWMGMCASGGIVCPNCAATLDTHCGHKLRLEPIACALCAREFQPKYSAQRYCSRTCGQRAARSYEPRPETRKVPRPTYERLMQDLAHMSWLAVGRKYGVSDNAVRKWVRWYERDAEAA